MSRDDAGTPGPPHTVGGLVGHRTESLDRPLRLALEHFASELEASSVGGGSEVVEVLLPPRVVYFRDPVTEAIADRVEVDGIGDAVV